MTSSLKSILYNVLNRIYPAWKGKNYTCPACYAKLKYFYPFPSLYKENWEKYKFKYGEQQEMLNVKNYRCPSCGCIDRNRLSILYIRQYLGYFNERIVDILEIAPTTETINFFKKNKNINYRSADLQSALAEDKVDITNMNIYQNNTFDFIYCSHVLEHVTEDRKALNEIFRILKPGGECILLAPIIIGLEEDYEDNSIHSEIDRWKHFGQNDHVRLYSKKGYTKKIIDSGFDLKQLGIDYFGHDVFAYNGITDTSVLYVAKKPIR